MEYTNREMLSYPKNLETTSTHFRKYNVPHNTIILFLRRFLSTLDEIREAIGYGVIKMNIDIGLTIFTEGIQDYMNEKYRLPENTDRKLWSISPQQKILRSKKMVTYWRRHLKNA